MRSHRIASNSFFWSSSNVGRESTALIYGPIYLYLWNQRPPQQYTAIKKNISLDLKNIILSNYKSSKIKKAEFIERPNSLQEWKKRVLFKRDQLTLSKRCIQNTIFIYSLIHARSEKYFISNGTLMCQRFAFLVCLCLFSVHLILLFIIAWVLVSE